MSFKSVIIFVTIPVRLGSKKRYIPRSRWRVNNQIHAPKVRVIDEKKEQIGVLTIAKALEKAKEAKLDLVEIAPKAKPPVTQIIEFGKFKYNEEKKAKKAKAGSKASELKEIRFSPFIGEADYQSRLKRIKKFLADNHKIRTVVKFKGRQMGSKQFGYKVLQRIIDDLDTNIQVDMKPKFLGRHLVMVISPVSSGKNTEEIIVDKSKKKG